jgi:hypothetical protein
VAQPNLDFDNNGPVPTMAPWAVTLYGAATMEYGPGSPGPDELYGFWMVPETGNRDIFFVAPSVTPTSASFPGCTVISTDGGSDSTFWKVDASGSEILGVRSALEGILPFSNGSKELVYPCTYGTTWTDAFSANYVVGGSIPVTRAGTISGIADGYGTIQLPGIELENVLRVKVRKVALDQSVVANVSRTFDTYYYYQEGVKYPLMRSSLDSTTILGGQPTITFTMEWLYGPATFIGMSEFGPDDVVFTPYPNPTNGTLDLRMDTDMKEVRSIEVIDAKGQVVRQLVKPIAGTLTGVLDLSGLAAGVYQVRVLDAEGGQGTRRVVVQ